MELEAELPGPLMPKAELFTFVLGMELAVTDVTIIETAIAEAVVTANAGMKPFKQVTMEHLHNLAFGFARSPIILKSCSLEFIT